MQDKRSMRAGLAGRTSGAGAADGAGGADAGCADALARLGRHLAGELDPGAAARVAAHLEGCADCQSEAEAAARLDAAIARGFADHPFDDALAGRIIALAERRQRAGAVDSNRWWKGGAKGDGAARGAGSGASGRSEGRGGRIVLGWPVVGIAAAAALLVAVGLTIRGGLGQGPGAPAIEAAVALVRVDGAGGRLEVTRAASGSASSLADGHVAELRPGDRVLASVGGGRLELRDGTVVRFRPDTEVEVLGPEIGSSRRGGAGGASACAGIAVRGPGEVFCEVAARRPSEAAFAVHTDRATVEVLGTRFGVRVLPGFAVATVLEGEVRVRGSAGEALVARAGDQVRASGEGASYRLERSRPDLAGELGWAVPALAAARASGAAGAAAAGPGPGTAGGARPVAPPSAGPRSDLDLPIGIEADGEGR